MLWVWIINMFNFMDGMDGITSVQISSLSILTNFLAILGLIEESFIYFSLILLTISFAFYSVNKPPSKIFLGDVGSIPLGFIAGFILIYNMIMYNLILPFLIIMLYYLQDSIATIILRFLKKRKCISGSQQSLLSKNIEERLQSRLCSKEDNLFTFNSINTGHPFLLLSYNLISPRFCLYFFIINFL